MPPEACVCAGCSHGYTTAVVLVSSLQFRCQHVLTLYAVMAVDKAVWLYTVVIYCSVVQCVAG